MNQKIRKYTFRCFLFLLILVSNFTFGQNNVLHSNFFNRNINEFYSSVFQNPGLRFLTPDSTYVDAALSYNSITQEGLYDVMQGDEQINYHFNVNSVVRKENSFIYGNVDYNNGQNKNIKWNNIADAAFLYPYLISDTVGGDFYSESYSFKGGYVHLFDKLTLGLEGSYRAEMSYKKLDPRPKNTVSDLNLSVGLSMPLKKYRLATNMAFKSYQQRVLISIYKPGSGVKVFYMRGMGISDQNFSTVITQNSSLSNRYEGTAKSISCQIFPDKQNSGFFTALGYNTFDFQLNKSNNYAISELSKKRYQTDLGYLFRNKKIEISTKVFYNLQEDKGVEYEYDQTDNHLIASPQKYQLKKYTFGFESFFLNRISEKTHLFSSLSLNYFYQKEIYAIGSGFSSAYSYLKQPRVGVLFGLLKKIKKASLEAKFKVQYAFCLDDFIQTSEIAIETANETLVIPNFNYYAANSLQIKSTLRYTFFLTKEYKTYIQASYQNSNLEYQDISGKSNFYSFSLGFVL